MVQLGKLLGILLGPLLTTGLPLMKKVLKAFAKSVLIVLRLTEAASATESTIQKKVWVRYDYTDNLRWRNEWHHEIVQSLKDAGLLIKGVSESTENEAKEQKGGFLGMLLDTIQCFLNISVFLEFFSGIFLESNHLQIC